MWPKWITNPYLAYIGKCLNVEEKKKKINKSYIGICKQWETLPGWYTKNKTCHTAKITSIDNQFSDTIFTYIQ